MCKIENCSTPQPIAEKFFSGLVPNKELRMDNDIVLSALGDLRVYGIQEKDAIGILYTELNLLEDYKMSSTTSISPQLIELFGIQHIKDALNHAYAFIAEFEIEDEDYITVLTSLLRVFRPEQLIANPELIFYFLLRIRDSKDLSYENATHLADSVIKDMASTPLYDTTFESEES